MTEIITAIIALFGTCLGTFGGIYASAKLTTYRIEQLELKVDRHNSFAERIPIIEEKLKVINHRLDDLEKQEDDKR
jgi:ABC-type lipoprotein release transport system permease subunit